MFAIFFFLPTPSWTRSFQRTRTRPASPCFFCVLMGGVTLEDVRPGTLSRCTNSNHNNPNIHGACKHTVRHRTGWRNWMSSSNSHFNTLRSNGAVHRWFWDNGNCQVAQVLHSVCHRISRPSSMMCRPSGRKHFQDLLGFCSAHSTRIWQKLRNAKRHVSQRLRLYHFCVSGSRLCSKALFKTWLTASLSPSTSMIWKNDSATFFKRHPSVQLPRGRLVLQKRCTTACRAGRKKHQFK